LLQDGEVGIGVFPQSEKALVGGASLGSVARGYVGSRKSETSQGANGIVAQELAVLEHLLELHGCDSPLLRMHVSFSPNVNRDQWQKCVGRLVRSSYVEKFDRSFWVAGFKFDFGANGRYPVILHKRAQWKINIQLTC
jgi:hypothetical protein